MKSTKSKSGISLFTFLLTDEGHALWDSLELRLVVKEETVFILKMNAYVELDTLGFLNEEGSFKNALPLKYIVVNSVTIDGVNYIILEEARRDGRV